MAEPAAAAADSDEVGTAKPMSGRGDLSELRALLVGPEQRQLRALQSRLSDPARQIQEASRILPDAFALRATDPRLVEAVAPSVEQALMTSVRRNPQPIADALFPIMGPAIRKAITHALTSMMESFNRTLEYSLSWRSLRWRLTALRTGKSFAEIVLLNSLVYRVEQVFVIQPASGLLMQHVAADAETGNSADQISAMLTAIRDFAQDSFGVPAGQTLEALRVGDLSVSIEQGPHAVLAGVVRGTVPQSLRTTFQETLETLHLRYSRELESFSGDPDSLVFIRPILQSCLQTEYHPPKATRSRRGWAFAAALLLALGTWMVFSVRDRQRWNAYVDRLRAEPGIVVIASGRSGGKYFVTGLRDPLANDPDAILSRAGVARDDVERRWELYQSSESNLVLARARQVLRPPPGVSLNVQDQVLVAAGAAPSRWIRDNERLALMIPGVRQFDHGAVIADDLQAVIQQLESIAVVFPKGSSRVIEDVGTAKALAALRQLNDIARSLDRRAHVEVVGHTDSDGPPSSNLPLSVARAEAVLSLLPSSELTAVTLASRGVGSAEPLVKGDTEAEKQRNRRVSFRVGLPRTGQPGDRQK